MLCTMHKRMSRNLAFLFYLVSCSKRCPSAEFGHFLAASYLARDFSFVLADRGPTEGGREARLRRSRIDDG